MKLYKRLRHEPARPRWAVAWPMFIQMPIFFGFLYMLYTSAELRNSSFLWVRDLSQPDTVTRLTLPGLGSVPHQRAADPDDRHAQFWQMSPDAPDGRSRAAEDA